MTFITLTKTNLNHEHICCAISDKKSEFSVLEKKHWLSDRIDEGLKFVKAEGRGKVFIEYLPAEFAWVPVQAKGYLMINCHWVSGSYKNQGFGKALLQICEQDANDKNGVVLISSARKRPFLSNKAFFTKHGFEVCDKAKPYFELLVKRTNKEAPLPCFNLSAKEGKLEGEHHGIDIFYTVQCPFVLPYIELIQPVIQNSEIPVRLHQIVSRDEAQRHASAVTTYAVFVNGKFLTQEILTVAKLQLLIRQAF